MAYISAPSLEEATKMAGDMIPNENFPAWCWKEGQITSERPLPLALSQDEISQLKYYGCPPVEGESPAETINRFSAYISREAAPGYLWRANGISEMADYLRYLEIQFY